MATLSKYIILKNKEERRILAGHQWVFSNEIRQTVGAPAAGEIVELVAASGKSLGIGFYNPHSLIAFRLLDTRIREIDEAFFSERITQALNLREQLFPASSVYRLVHSESDFLPGLVIDRFNEYLSVQTFSTGMESRLDLICDVLNSLLSPKGIVERNESPLRQLEGLASRKGALRGEAGTTTIEDIDVRFVVDVLEGQKTGFFLDQRENRHVVRRFSKDASVLDCFCNDGGFALHAAAAGASSVVGIDSSADAIQRANTNATASGLSRVQFEQADVPDALKAMQSQSRTFDVVVLDPPSFTKSRKNVQPAKQGYKDLHAKALAVLNPGGILLTASCSHHIEPEVFLDIVDSTTRKAGRNAQLLEWRGASPDHPVLPSMPETRYLKMGVFHIA